MEKILHFASSWPGLIAATIILIAVEIYNRIILARASRLEMQALTSRYDLMIESLRREKADARHRAHDQLAYFINFSECVRNLTGATRIRDIVNAADRALGMLLHCTNVAVFVADHAGKMRLVGGTGFDEKQRNRFVFPGRDTLNDLAEGGVVVQLIDFPRAEAAIESLRGEFKLAAPLTVGDQLIGLILVSELGIEAELGRRVLGMYSGVCGEALSCALEFEQLRRSTKKRKRRKTRRTKSVSIPTEKPLDKTTAKQAEAKAALRQLQASIAAHEAQVQAQTAAAEPGVVVPLHRKIAPAIAHVIDTGVREESEPPRRSSFVAAVAAASNPPPEPEEVRTPSGNPVVLQRL